MLHVFRSQQKSNEQTKIAIINLMAYSVTTMDVTKHALLRLEFDFFLFALDKLKLEEKEQPKKICVN